MLMQENLDNGNGPQNEDANEAGTEGDSDVGTTLIRFRGLGDVEMTEPVCSRCKSQYSLSSEQKRIGRLAVTLYRTLHEYDYLEIFELYGQAGGSWPLTELLLNLAEKLDKAEGLFGLELGLLCPLQDALRITTTASLVESGDCRNMLDLFGLIDRFRVHLTCSHRQSGMPSVPKAAFEFNGHPPQSIDGLVSLGLALSCRMKSKTPEELERAFDAELDHQRMANRKEAPIHVNRSDGHTTILEGLDPFLTAIEETTPLWRSWAIKSEKHPRQMPMGDDIHSRLFFLDELFERGSLTLTAPADTAWVDRLRRVLEPISDLVDWREVPHLKRLRDNRKSTPSTGAE